MDSAKAPCMLGIGCVGTETWTSFIVSDVELSFLGVVAPLRSFSFSSVDERVDESSEGVSRVRRPSFSLSCEGGGEEML